MTQQLALRILHQSLLAGLFQFVVLLPPRTFHLDQQSLLRHGVLCLVVRIDQLAVHIDLIVFGVDLHTDFSRQMIDLYATGFDKLVHLTA